MIVTPDQVRRAITVKLAEAEPWMLESIYNTLCNNCCVLDCKDGIITVDEDDYKNFEELT